MKRLLVALLLLVPTVALAQVVTPAATTPITIVPAGGVIDYGQAFGWLQPYAISIASALIAALGSWLTYLVHKFTGLKIDETLSKGYITQAQNQASGLIAGGFVIIREDGKVQINNVALAAAVDDLLKAVPDAVTRFDLQPRAVAEKIVAMVPQVPAAAPAIAAVVPEAARKSK